MSDLDSEYYEKCEATLEALGKTGLPVLAVFSPANPKKPIVLQGGCSRLWVDDAYVAECDPGMRTSIATCMAQSINGAPGLAP
jgi:hypothetical protein